MSDCVPLPQTSAPTEPATGLPTRDISQEVRILHVDAALIVVGKPAGLLAVPGRGPERADCVFARVQSTFADALIVHRLDMATSGLMVFARGLAAQRSLSRAFEQRRVEKTYVAVVAGQLADDSGTIDLPLICDWPRRPRQKVDFASGKPALTHWQVLSREARHACTRVQLKPVTGRSHQLRVHMLAIGHPILGDDLYGADAAAAAQPGRLLLHAAGLEFPHPADGQRVSWRDPAPF